MIKEKTCCGFFLKLCKKMCIKTSVDGVKPDFQVVHVGMNKGIANDSKKNSGLSHRSSIVKGNSKQSIKHPSVGFVQTIETNEIKYSNADCNKNGRKECAEGYSDVTIFTEQVAQEVVMNMEEAYKIIKSEDKIDESGISELNRSQEFAKKVKKLDIKSILAEQSVSEQSC
jgi:hypothetical protein